MNEGECGGAWIGEEVGVDSLDNLNKGLRVA